MTPPRKPKQSLQYAKRMKRNVEVYKTLTHQTRLTATQRKSCHFLSELPEVRQSRQ